jgi:hypothetical protein
VQPDNPFRSGVLIAVIIALLLLFWQLIFPPLTMALPFPYSA